MGALAGTIYPLFHALRPVAVKSSWLPVLALVGLLGGCVTAPQPAAPLDRPMVCAGVDFGPKKLFMAITTDASDVVIRKVHMLDAKAGKMEVLAERRFDCVEPDRRHIERQLRYFADDARWDQSVSDGPHYIYFADGHLKAEGYSPELDFRHHSLLIRVALAET